MKFTAWKTRSLIKLGEKKRSFSQHLKPFCELSVRYADVSTHFCVASGVMSKNAVVCPLQEGHGGFGLQWLLKNHLMLHLQGGVGCRDGVIPQPYK